MWGKLHHNKKSQGRLFQSRWAGETKERDLLSAPFKLWPHESSPLLCLVRVWLRSACGNTATDVCSCLHWAGGNWGSLALSSGALCCSVGAPLLLNQTSHISLLFSLILPLCFFSFLSSHASSSPSSSSAFFFPFLFLLCKKPLPLSEKDDMSASP